jgi:hypothetical protein
MDRTSAQPQVKLNFSRINSLKLQPLVTWHQPLGPASNAVQVMFVPFDSIFTVLPGTFGENNYIWVAK